MRLIPLLLLAALPGPLSAQLPHARLELGIDAAYWQLDHGSASVRPTEGVGWALRAGALLGRGAPMAIQATASYTRETESAPGLLHLAAEYAPRLFRVGPESPNVFLMLGAGTMRFDADREDERLEECTPETACLNEGISYRSGWRSMLHAGVGFDLPIERAISLQPTLSILKATGEDDAGAIDPPPFLRIAVGLAVRP